VQNVHVFSVSPTLLFNIISSVLPALQTQALRAVLLDGEVLEAGQLVQLPVPVAVL
jgi:hypothetical protein